MDGAGEAAYLDLWSLLWNSPYAAPAGAVVVSTDAPLDEETAYTVTFSDPEAGETFSRSLDAEGVCRSTASRATAAWCAPAAAPARILPRRAVPLL